MKIVHIITRLIVGGAQENTLLSCEGQHDLGHHVTLITGPALGPEGSLMQRASSHGYRVETIDAMRRSILPLKDWRIYRQLIRRLREIKPDVVHTHSSKAGIIGRWAAHAAGVPVIIHTIHGLAFTASKSAFVNSAYRQAEKLAAPITTRIVCVADAMREQSLAGGVGKRGQYVTVYSGMNTGPFLHPPVPRKEIRQKLGLADDHVAVGTIARLFYMKGHEDLLAAAPELCRKYPNLRFLWVGDGLLRGEFERRINEMNLADRFILTGLVPPEKVPELTNAMDILVHPSRREGLARALPQGALAGCPVVAYDIDGNREGLIPDATGFVLKPFDTAGLSAKIELLLADADLRRKMGTAGREFALGRFDTKVMVDALEKVYREAGAAGA
ncbi:MAG TPA: glycosyltransferase family 4 protein [Tepidisphaeraceae bacterium]|jgi:glycosyltransferase involved in cell wall biosynthesis|nr:glycosyltransferase family 4 protein [Tepidisphaeraceae bacterium]